MLSRLSITAALAACVVAVAPVCAQAPAAGMIRCTYQVADLVTPLPEAKIVATSGSAKADKTEKARPTREAWLIEQILNTVQPASWAAHDGAGTVDYFPMTGCLVVNQMPDVQKQVADLLTEMRKQQDTQVALEVRIVTVSEDVFEQIGVDFNTATVLEAGQKVAVQAAVPLCAPMLPQGAASTLTATFLNDKQVSQLLETAAADQRTNVLMAPRITVSNGQEGSIAYSAAPVAQTCTAPMTAPCLANSFHMTALPRVSADRRYVQVAMNLDKTEQTPAKEVSSHCINTTASIPDGGTVLIGGLKKVNEVRREYCPPVISMIPYVNRLFKNVGYGRENQLEFVLVTPRIVMVEEKEEQRPCVMTPAIVPPPAVLPCPVAPVQIGVLPLPPGQYLQHLPQYAVPSGPFPLSCELALPPACPVQQAACTVAQPMGRQAGVVAELLKAYDEACAEGKTAEAKKYAHAALLLDPTCFSKKR